MLQEKRQFALLKQLLSANAPLSSVILAKQLQVTSRTIRDMLNVVEEVISPYGVHIASKAGKGIYLAYDNENCMQSFAQIFQQASLGLENMQQYSYRTHLILLHIMLQDKPILLEDLAELLFMSRTTMYHAIKEVRRALAQFHLQLCQKAGVGTYIQGEDIACMQCFSVHFMALQMYRMPQLDALLDEMLERYSAAEANLRNELYRILHIYNISISYHHCRILICHLIYMQIKKTRMQRTMPTLHPSIWQAAGELALVLHRRMQFVASQDMLALLLASYKNMPDALQIASNAYAAWKTVVENFLANIDHTYDLYVADMQDMQEQISSHLLLLSQRLAQGISFTAVPLQTIKRHSPLSFELALLLAEHCRHACQLCIPIEEIGCLAYIFQSKMTMRSYNKFGKRLMIVSAFGKDTAHIMQNRIKKSYAQFLQKADVCECYELPFIDKTSYDLILTDLPHTECHLHDKQNAAATALAMHHMSLFIDDSTMQQLKKLLVDYEGVQKYFLSFFHEELFFAQLHASDRADALRVLCTHIAKQDETVSAEQLFAKAMEREAFSSTALGNQAAVAKICDKLVKKTVFAVAILDKPIVWGTDSVQIVLLYCVGKSNPDLSVLGRPLRVLFDDTMFLHKMAQLSSFYAFEKLVRDTIFTIQEVLY